MDFEEVVKKNRERPRVLAIELFFGTYLQMRLNWWYVEDNPPRTPNCLGSI